jgi:chromate transporter
MRKREEVQEMLPQEAAELNPPHVGGSKKQNLMHDNRSSAASSPTVVSSAEIHGHPSLLQLFAAFLKLGATAFGGPAMVAHIRKMAVEKEHWLDDATFKDGVALCQAIPGATAMQTTAYVGLRARGLPGAAASFAGFGLPAFCFMLVLSVFYSKAHELPLVVAAFQGLRAITVAIVAHAAFTFGKRSLHGAADILICCLAALLFGFKANPIVVIVLAAILGLLLYRKRTEPVPQVQQEPSLSVQSRWRVTPLVLAAAVGFALLFSTHPGLFDLGALMIKVDLFAFGGGFASIPVMYHEIVDVRSWMDGKTFMNGIALGQVTPGPIVITATFVGYYVRGLAGAVVATVSVFLPSFLMVVGIVPYFDRLRSSERFNRCISGILASFVGLLLSVTIQFASGISWDVPRILLAAASLAALLFEVDVLWVVLAGIAVAIITLP